MISESGCKDKRKHFKLPKQSPTFFDVFFLLKPQLAYLQQINTPTLFTLWGTLIVSAPLLFPTLFHSPIIYSDTPALKIAVRSRFRRAETSTEATNTTVQAPKSGEKSLKIFVAFSCYRRKTGGSPRHPKIKIAIKRHADYSKISGKSCKYPTVIPTKAPLRSQYSLPSDPKFTEKTMRQHLKSPLRAVR